VESLGIELAERRWLPDSCVRFGIRRLLRARLAQERARHSPVALARALRLGALAVSADAANAQHYEVPAELFRLALGPRMKYSSAFFAGEGESLADAEERMLALTCERAELADGMRILDLGCGWGALSLYVAERFPHAEIVAVSNSKSQREAILGECAARGVTRIDVLTADVNRFAPDGRFDRVVSVEMFEHLRNWELALARIARWLGERGKLFLHVFRHRELAYSFEDEGASDWLARHFFSGGIMPSQSLVREFDRNLSVEAEWSIFGTHYARTAEAWLANLDRERADALRCLARVYGADAPRALARWRMFFMACAELFGFAGGSEWGVAQYRLTPRRSGLSR
jgi:cyclopropane-fatty-acyl-phospholipid synthase